MRPVHGTLRYGSSHGDEVIRSESSLGHCPIRLNHGQRQGFVRGVRQRFADLPLGEKLQVDGSVGSKGWNDIQKRAAGETPSVLEGDVRHGDLSLTLGQGGDLGGAEEGGSCVLLKGFNQGLDLDCCEVGWLLVGQLAFEIVFRQ